MFFAPAFLLGLLAIGLPLWLHRFARESDEKRPFASLMLLEASKVHHSRRHTLRYLLLLALRLALLILLVLAFAEPMLRARAGLAGGQPATLHAIALDTSMSMGYGERWEQAIARAQEAIGAMGSNDYGMIVAADNNIRIVHGPVHANAAQELRSALATLRPGLARLDYGMLMTSSESWLDAKRWPTRLHFITDLQESASPLRFADLRPPAGVELNLIDVGEAEAGNLYVESAGIAAYDANTIEVRVNGVPAGGESREVILSIDGREQARQRIAPNEAGPIRVPFPNLQLGTGNLRVSAALEPADAVPQDDRFYLVLERTEPRVLLVTGNTSADDASYLAAAIGALTRPRLAVDRSTPGRMGERNLADYAAVVVSDAGILTEAAAESIDRYLRSGGAVLMTLGPRAAAQDVVPLSGHEVAGGRLQSRRNDASPGRVSVVDESHPVLREVEGWRSIRFFRHVPIEPAEEDNVLIRFESGQPLLLERRMGAGHLLVFASPLNRDWNDLAIHPLFVRFIGDAARYLTGADAQVSSATVGAPSWGAFLNGRAGAQVFDPQGRRVLSLGDTVGSLRLVPEQVGFYELRGGGRVEWLAVNVDRRESNLTRMAPGNVERWQQLPPPEPAATDASAAQADETPRWIPVWLWLLMAAVALAFLEPLVANYHLYVRREVTS